MKAQRHQISENQHRTKVPTVTGGLYLDRPPSHIPDGAMSACSNVRIKDGNLRNDFMGWKEFGSTAVHSFAVNDILLIDEHVSSNGTRILVIGTTEHLYEWSGTEFLFITPTYTTGTASGTTGSPTIAGAGGTAWNLNTKVGDWIHIGDANHQNIGSANDWYQITAVDVGGVSLTIHTNHATTTGAVVYTILKTFTGLTSDLWSVDMFRDAPSNEDLLIATNGSEIVKWDGVATEATDITSALGFTCKSVRYYKNMMLYANLTISSNRFPGSVRNSALSAPENVSTAEAGEQKVADRGEILTMEPLGDAMICYGDKTVEIMQFVGSPTNFALRTALADKGIVSSRGVINFEDYHEFCSVDRAFRFDGAVAREIGRHVMRNVLDGIDPNRLVKFISFLDEAVGTAIWVVPLSSDGVSAGEPPTTAFTNHYQEASGNDPSPYTQRDLPALSLGKAVDSGTNTWDDYTDTFADYDITWGNANTATPLVLMGLADGKVYKLNIHHKKVGVGIPSSARFSRRPAIDGVSMGRVHWVEPVTEGGITSTNYGLVVSVRAADQEDGDSVEIASGEFDLTHAGVRRIPINQAGRHIEIEISTDAISPIVQSWAMSSYAVVISTMGNR